MLAIAALSKESGETPDVETLVATNCSVTQKRASWRDGLTLTYNTETVNGALPVHHHAGQDTVDTSGLSAYLDLDANEIGAVAISDAKSGLIRLLTAPVGHSQDC